MIESEQHSERLSDILRAVFDPQKGISSYGELIDRLDQHGMAVILVLFSIPSALPVPAAGYSTALSIPLFLIGLRLALGYHTVWLPNRIRNRPFDPSKAEKLFGWMNRLVLFIEKFSKPRLCWLACSKGARFFLGMLICLLALSMALPIPGTNTLPAGGIFLIGFGLLEEDGFLVLGGVIYSILALCLSVFIILFGYDVVKSFIKDFL